MSDELHPAGQATPVALAPEALQQINDRVAEAVRDGIKGAITEDAAEAFWLAGLAVFQKQATAHAGRFVLGGILGLARKALVFLALGGLFYAVGGWAGLALLFKALFDGGGR